MDIKKLAAGAAGAAMLLSLAVPAFAWFDSATIVGNHATVENMTFSIANTGLNGMVAGDDVEGGMIDTGAAGAESVVTNVVNTTVVNGPVED